MTTFEHLLKKDFVILDGGMGTMLQARGLKLGEIPELLNITSGQIITDIHKEYVEAGSDIIYANTFGANKFKFARTEYSVSDVIKAGIANARKAVEGTETLVGLDIGPIGRMLKPIGDLDFEDAYEVFKEIVIAGSAADVAIIETMTNLAETKAAVLAVKENSSLPVICTMSYEQNGRTFTGCTIPSMAYTLEGLGIDAIGFNCSLGPEELIDFVNELRKYTKLPIVLKPNAGLPNPETNLYDITKEEFASEMVEGLNSGVKFFGGCCGTTPEFICTLKEALENFVKSNAGKAPVYNREIFVPAVCTQSKAVFLNEPRVIGERINPTGKKLFKEALQKHDIDYILKQAIEQIDAGADILDVNVGLPGIDEKEMMVTTIEAIQGITDTPLQIDSTDSKVVEKALRIYDGIPILNSVNGEQKSLDSLLPLVAKYGAMVIGLTLDEDGIPKTAEKRYEIASRIVSECEKYNIPRHKIIIDCLTLTASAEQEGVMETINAQERIRNELGVKTVLGVSNISFGLPNRELINRTFLTMALLRGLDLAIINPNNLAMMETMYAYKVLRNIDKNSVNYIEFEALNNTGASGKTVTVAAKASSSSSDDFDNMIAEDLKAALMNGIEKGLKEKCHKLITKLLLDTDPMEVIDQVLIPALDNTGVLFEAGKIYLPQLIMSATAAGVCFDEIKKLLSSRNQSSVSKGLIVMATVKGDIHDIGKNIVKVLLENYGYEVIDLGKDVDCQAVVDAAKKHNAKLVGLSALMTTTLVSMEETIRLLREQQVDCKVFVGGAVLTKDYAMKIGADYYSKDAKQSVDIARTVFGQ